MKYFRKVFLAIPCGEFYENQKKIIITICENLNLEPIINEDDSSTNSLLSQITEQINEADLFIADISSNSPNVVFELGYAYKSKYIDNIGILLSNISKCPSDLQDFKRIQYNSFNDLAEKLYKWLSQFSLNNNKPDFNKIKLTDFYESFQDNDRFLRLWSLPLGCNYSLTYNGFRFTNAHIPIITKHLAFLDNYVFEFDCLINNSVIGWIVKGTKFDYNDNLIDFCIMINLNIDGNIHPHIFSKLITDGSGGYKSFDRLKITHNLDLTKRLNVKTFVNDSKIKILINDNLCFDDDFNNGQYKSYYNLVPIKTNQIGFRCHPSEEATVCSVKVSQI